nr:MAG TPA: hypothetical protein [Caudoviricetes sp.]
MKLVPLVRARTCAHISALQLKERRVRWLY